MELTKEDIKTLKYEKRIGFVFALLIFGFGGVFSLFFYAIDDFFYSQLIGLSTVLLIFLTPMLINRKVNKDMKMGIKFVRKEKIEEKVYRTLYEAGSAYPLPFWGKMKPFPGYFLIIKRIEYNVEKELFESVEKGDIVEIYEGIHSGILLGIKKYLII